MFVVLNYFPVKRRINILLVSCQQHEGHNIFSHLSPAEYKTVLGYMKECILATDLALFFGNKSKLKDLVDKGEFSWENQEHR